MVGQPFVHDATAREQQQLQGPPRQGGVGWAGAVPIRGRTFENSESGGADGGSGLGGGGGDARGTGGGLGGGVGGARPMWDRTGESGMDRGRAGHASVSNRAGKGPGKGGGAQGRQALSVEYAPVQCPPPVHKLAPGQDSGSLPSHVVASGWRQGMRRCACRTHPAGRARGRVAPGMGEATEGQGEGSRSR